MAAVTDMLAVVLFGLFVAAGVAPGADSASQYHTVDGDAQGGHLVPKLKNFRMLKFQTYHAGVEGSGNAVNFDQSLDHTIPDLPKRFSHNQYQKQEGAVATQESSSGSFDDEGYANNARFDFDTDDVNVDNDARYDYNPSGKVLPAKEVPADELRPSYLYDARAGKHGGSAEFTATESEQHERSAHRAVPAKGHHGPVSVYTPGSDRHGPFYFTDTRSDAQKDLSSNVDHDSASATSLASGSTSATTQATRGTHGCPNSYWAEHVVQWPAPLKITTLVAQAFGGVTVKASLEIVYGTTTLFQALMDTRDDPYSKLLRHAVAALLNAHTKLAFPLRPAEVAKLFHAALVSEVAAAAQAQKFENENHAFGDNECK